MIEMIQNDRHSIYLNFDKEGIEYFYCCLLAARDVGRSRVVLRFDMAIVLGGDQSCETLGLEIFIVEEDLICNRIKSCNESIVWEFDRGDLDCAISPTEDAVKDGEFLLPEFLAVDVPDPKKKEGWGSRQVYAFMTMT